MKRYVALVMVALLVLGLVPGGAFGSVLDDDPIYQRWKFLISQIDYMNTNSVQSTVYTSTMYIDLGQINSSGTVNTYVYSNENPTPVTGSFTTTPRNFDYAVEKVVRYVLGNVANTYRQPPLNVEMTMITNQRDSIPLYVYGDYRAEAIEEIKQGLPTCFDISYDTSRGRSDPIAPIPMPVAEGVLSAIFSINSTTFTLNNEAITMDVAPEVKDNRTYVPIRYLANSLGVSDQSISWDSASGTATITKDNKLIGITVGSNTMAVMENGTTSLVTMDTAPYIKEGRVMLPARWVAEPLGAIVEWDEATQQTVITVT